MSDNELSDDSEYILSLDTLPVEVFLCICSYLNAEVLLNSLRLVCKRFNDIISDEGYWKTWMKHRWPSLRIRALDISNEGKDVSLKTVCYHIDNELHLWSGGRGEIKKIQLKDFHSGSVDAVKLLKNGEYVVSASRDRNIAVWAVGKGETKTPVAKKIDAHHGWIWDIAVNESSRFYTGSFDSTVKLWDLEKDFMEICCYSTVAGVVSLVAREDMIVAGLYSPKIQIFDARSGPNSVETFTQHQRSIMAVELCGDYILSASEDRTISVIDIKAGKVYKSGLYVNSNPKAYPKSLHCKHNMCCVGDSEGMLHNLNTVNSQFEVTESFVDHSRIITTLWQGLGCIITGSLDRSVHILSPTSPPSLIVEYSFSGQVTSLDYMNSVLAIGSTEEMVEVLLPSNYDE